MCSSTKAKWSFVSLDDAMASLNPKLDDYGSDHLPSERKLNLLNRLRNSYYYVRLTRKG